MLEQINKLLKRYDKLLSLKGRLSGRKELIRQSPFNKYRQHPIYLIENKFIGHWLLRKVMMMDSQKHDFVKSTLKHNEKVRNNADKYSRDRSSDMARFIKENEKIVI